MTRRGWCPTLYEPMRSGDGLLLRVKPPRGILPAEAVPVLAEAALRYGNGMIGLTNRANLQFRGFTPDSAEAFASIVVGLGLAATDPGRERRRNVLVSPLAGIDPAVGSDVRTMADAIEALLVGDPALEDLPGKFAITVDGGGALPVADAPADILLQPEDGMVRISLDGSDLACLVPADDCVAATRRLILAFLDQPARHRMRDLVAAEVFATAGLNPTARRRTPARGLPVGKQPGGAFGIGAAFGQMSAGDLAELATLARQHGDATLRLSPWRVILLPGITETPATRLITDPADPLLDMQACPGMPFCGAASVRTLDDATALAAVARGRGIHVSGCAKGCAHRLPSAITLVGENGVYNLIRNGRADSPPVLRGQSISVLAAILTAERLP